LDTEKNKSEKMPEPEELIPKHGGYRKLKSFQIAELIFDVTVRFCDRYISKFSRTHDQMVQAARSGVQNIAEGSQASGTSRKMELKLTNVARASLEELKCDYMDFLRQRGFPMWEPNHPSLMRFKKRRCNTVEDVRAWLEEEKKHGRTQTNTDRVKHKNASVPVRESPCPLPQNSVYIANATLSLLNICCYLLDKQLAAQAKKFKEEGGFTERLYRIRHQKRKKS
jgi:four helix bundle suffix protein